MSSRKAVTVWSKSDFYFQALHCRDIKGCQFFPNPKKTMTAFTFPLNHNLLFLFHVFLFSLECLFIPHCILNMVQIFDVCFKITCRREPDLMAGGARQTRLQVPPSLHHSNLNRAAVIAKAIKESVKKDLAGVKDTLCGQKNTIRERRAEPWQGKSS